MSDVRIAVENITKEGINLADTGSLSTGDVYLIRNGGDVIVHFKKTASVNCTVTVQTPVQVAGLAVAEHTFVVPATTGDIHAGPFPPSVFNDGDKDLRITLSDVDGLTIAAGRIRG